MRPDAGRFLESRIQWEIKILVTLQAQSRVKPRGALKDPFIVPTTYAIQAPDLALEVELQRFGGFSARRNMAVIETEIFDRDAFFRPFPR